MFNENEGLPSGNGDYYAGGADAEVEEED